MQIRAARAEDAPRIHALLHKAYGARTATEQPAGAALGDTVEDVAASIARQDVLVAENAEGDIIGTIATRHIANLRRLAVDPDRAKQGVAAQLVDAATRAAQEAGAELAVVDQVDGHPWLPAFYAKRDFTEHAVETRPDGSRWLVLRKQL